MIEAHWVISLKCIVSWTRRWTSAKWMSNKASL